MPFKQCDPGGRDSNDSLIFHRVEADQSPIVRVFPDGKFGTRSAPRLHRLFVASFPFGEPFEKVQDKALDNLIARYGLMFLGTQDGSSPSQRIVVRSFNVSSWPVTTWDHLWSRPKPGNPTGSAEAFRAGICAGPPPSC